jgi:hypothetical protein
MIKHYRHIDKMLNKVKAERDKKGYRENMGYDLYPKVCDYLAKQNLNYRDECKVKDYFDKQCDLI